MTRTHVLHCMCSDQTHSYGYIEDKACFEGGSNCNVWDLHLGSAIALTTTTVPCATSAIVWVLLRSYPAETHLHSYTAYAMTHE